MRKKSDELESRAKEKEDALLKCWSGGIEADELRANIMLMASSRSLKEVTNDAKDDNKTGFN